MTTLPPPVQDSVPLVPPPVAPTPSSSSAPASNPSRPDAHTQRYDRQLRLWAHSGQTALENSHLLVVSSNATATSTLKNLVLPGVGQFTLLDDALVTPQDLGTNFFLEPSSIGLPRAEQAVQFLGELNHDVKGHAIVESLTTFLASGPERLAPYSLVLAVDVEPVDDLVKLANHAWQLGIPLVRVESYGFLGSVTTQVEEVALVETHPESLIDLRLEHPFPTLVEWVETAFPPYEDMDSAQHSHAPAVVILVRALERWKRTHDGNTPQGFDERKQFLAQVAQDKRSGDAENFDEAIALYRRAGTKRPVPQDIEDLFQDDACKNLTPRSSNFWVLLHTLELFVRHPSNPAGLLPLTGALPDMKSHSVTYTTLQTLYRSKAKQDLSLFRQILNEQVVPKVTEPGQDSREFGQDEVESFVKHSAWIKVLRGRKLESVIDPQTSLLNGKINELLEQASWSTPIDNSIPILLAFQTSSRFYSKHHRYPGSLPPDQDSDGKRDLEEMRSIMKGLLQELNYSSSSPDLEQDEGLPESILNSLQEICRSSHSTLPQTSALLGGIVAQETIKLVTKQYVPLVGDVCVWDGITSMTGRVKA